MSTNIYFVRHAKSDHTVKDGRIRPLTPEGLASTAQVKDFFRDKHIDAIYCSPYKRSIDTIRPAAEMLGLEIVTDERLRERENGLPVGAPGMYDKRWLDFDFHEPNGESIHMVQARNIEALTEILVRHPGDTLMIGTHGTALSSIINYYDPTFGIKDFLRIVDWLPYIVELRFEGEKYLDMAEHFHIEYEGTYRQIQGLKS